MSVDAHSQKTLYVPGDGTDTSREEFERSVRAFLSTEPPVLTVDCSRLEQVVSRHINMLWTAHLLCDEAGVRMHLREASPGLIRILHVLDLYDFFECDESFVRRSLQKAAGPALFDEDGRVYSDEFCPDSSGITEAQERFLAFLGELSIPEMIEFELRTIFYEVANNISGHAGVSPRDLVIFAATVNSERITMTFADSGMPFDPVAGAPEVNLREAAVNGQCRGFGLAMVKKMTDDMKYVRKHDAINLLTLEKRWSDSQ